MFNKYKYLEEEGFEQIVEKGEKVLVLQPPLPFIAIACEDILDDNREYDVIHTKTNITHRVRSNQIKKFFLN